VTNRASRAPVTQTGSEMKCYDDGHSNTIHELSRKAGGRGLTYYSTVWICTSNSMEIQGIEAGTTRNRVPVAGVGRTGTGSQVTIEASLYTMPGPVKPIDCASRFWRRRGCRPHVKVVLRFQSRNLKDDFGTQGPLSPEPQGLEHFVIVALPEARYAIQYQPRHLQCLYEMLLVAVFPRGLARSRMQLTADPRIILS